MEEGFHAVYFKFQNYGFIKTVFKICNMDRLSVGLRIHSRSHGCKKMGILRFYGMFRIQLQGALKGFFKLIQEMKRASKKGHMASYGLAAGQAGDGLIYHCLENRSCKILPCGAVIYKRLNV